MNFKGLVFFTTLALFLSAQAGILTKELGTNEIAGIQLGKSASVKLNNTNLNLSSIGAGLRQKKVLISNVKVYVAELYSAEPNKIIKNPEQILNSLEASSTIAMQLTFLRTVEAEKVQVSFRDALVANNVNLDEPAIAALLSNVVKGGEAKDKGTLTFIVNKNPDGTETLYYETTEGVVTSVTGSQLSKKVFSMWVGEPADDGLKKLKEEILK